MNSKYNHFFRGMSTLVTNHMYYEFFKSIFVKYLKFIRKANNIRRSLARTN